MSKRVEELDEFVKGIGQRCTLESWTSFVRELQVPSELTPAMLTNRPELIKLVAPTAKTADEVKVLYALIAGLLETNAGLRVHAEQLAHSVNHWSESFKQLDRIGHQIERFANFQPIIDPEAETEG